MIAIRNLKRSYARYASEDRPLSILAWSGFDFEEVAKFEKVSSIRKRLKNLILEKIASETMKLNSLKFTLLTITKCCSRLKFYMRRLKSKVKSSSRADDKSKLGRN